MSEPAGESRDLAEIAHSAFYLGRELTREAYGIPDESVADYMKRGIEDALRDIAAGRRTLVLSTDRMIDGLPPGVAAEKREELRRGLDETYDERVEDQRRLAELVLKGWEIPGRDR